MKSLILKEKQRAYLKQIKKNILAETKENLDYNITQNILKMPEYRKADILMAYMAGEIEINVDLVITDFLFREKKVAIPKCKNNEDMDFYFINNLTEIDLGMYNIREPKDGLLRLSKQEDIDKFVLMFLPGLGFNKSGYRIGYGKGYYDRYLDSLGFRVYKVGLCYEKTLIECDFQEDHDIPADAIVTEKQIIYLKKDI